MPHRSNIPRSARRSPAMLTGLVLAVALGLAVVVAGMPSRADAQTTDAEWAFAPLGIFADPRVQVGIASQVDSARAGEASGVALSFHQADGLVAPAEEAPLLLAAAGIIPPEGGNATGLVVERPCRTWAANPRLRDAATVLGEELGRVWAQYGVTVAPCLNTDDPTLADVIVFAAGSPPAEVDLLAARSTGSFLGSSQMPGAGGDDVVVPAEGGSLGDGDGDDVIATAIGLAVAVLCVAGARRISARGGVR